MRDPDYEDLLPLLSVPAAQHDPGLGGVTRRRFLQGTLATDRRRHARHHRAGRRRRSRPPSPPPTASS